MNYDLELTKVIEQINKNKPKLVLIQLPDGLKSQAKQIQEQIEKNTKSKVITWLGSCFGACDIPESKHVDMVIQFGHSQWRT